MTPKDESETKHSTSRKKNSKPSIRVNSEKLHPLKPESLVEVEEQSEFSQWRQGHREVKEQDLVQPAVASTNETTLPWWKRRLKALGIGVGVLLAIVVLFIGVVFYSPLLAVKTIQVEGASLISQSAVEEKLQVLEGVPLTRITDQQVADLVGNQNMLRDVTIEAQPPHGLVVKLQERVPVAVVQDGNEYVLVDNDGVQLTRVSSRDDAQLPLIDDGLDVLNTEEFKTVTSVLAALPSSLLSQVTSTKADSASSIKLELSDGVEVVWGTADESELKAKVLTQLMNALGQDGEVKTYDVSSPLRPTTK